MTARRGLLAALRGRREKPLQNTENASAVPSYIDPAAVQIFAHTLIADLFGAGVRIGNIASEAPEALRPELDEVADHLDKVIKDVREFVFSHARRADEPG